MAFGLGDCAIYVLLAFAAVWQILSNTAAGVCALDPRWLSLARSLAATRRDIVARIVVPGVMGHVLTGSRLAIGIVWIVLVPDDMLAVLPGSNTSFATRATGLPYPELMAVALVICVIGLALDASARGLHRRDGVCRF